MKLLEHIKNYNPYNEQEQNDKKLILHCITAFEDILTRNNELVHLTSSAFVINKSKDKMLMVHHNIYNSWSWAGGHADGDADLLAVAIKEVKEETGLKNVNPLIESIFSLDVLPVLAHTKNNKYISAHLHLSVTYLLVADENEALAAKPDENSAVKWVPFEDVITYSNEPHMKLVYKKLLDKIKTLTA